VESVTLLIEKKFFGYWSEIELEFAIDEFASCHFKAPFEPDRAEFRETFRPFTFKPLTVLHELGDFFAGTLIDVKPNVTPEVSEVDVTGYARPGVLIDCTAPSPSSEKPIAFQNVGLRAICEKLTAPFGIECVFPDGEGPVFKSVKLEIDKKIFEFLTDLAKQRNLVISNTPDGKLRCWKSAPVGQPVARFVAGKTPITSIKANYNPQEYFSEITGFAKKRPRGKATETNPFLTAVLRPDAFKLDDSEKGDAPEAVRAKLGRMFANILSIEIEDIPTWRDPNGNLWRENTTVTLIAPHVMVYRETEFLVRKVKLRQDQKQETASLTLVLPGAFSGNVPDVLPWTE
jgi:prophage tail gpP-like protein